MDLNSLSCDGVKVFCASCGSSFDMHKVRCDDSLSGEDVYLFRISCPTCLQTLLLTSEQEYAKQLAKQQALRRFSREVLE